MFSLTALMFQPVSKQDSHFFVVAEVKFSSFLYKENYVDLLPIRT